MLLMTATAFFVLVFGLTLLVVLNQKSRARWLLDYPSLPAFSLISLGLGLQTLSLALGLAQESFAIIVVKRVLELASRATLTIGLVGSYYPLRKQTKESRPGRERPQRQGARSISNPVAGSFLKMDTSATQSFHQRASRGPGQSSVLHDRVVSRYVSRCEVAGADSSHLTVDPPSRLHHRHSISPTCHRWPTRFAIEND
jgi:hypothetical protein